MRVTSVLVVLAALTACAPGIPDSGAGVGFGDYNEYLRQKAAREAALTGNALPPPNSVSSEPLSAGAAPASEAEQLAADTRAALGVDPATGREAVQASPSNPPPAVVNAAGISRENYFEAVDAERSIEEDAARIAQNRAQYQVIQPEAIGPRPGDVGPNIVAYALGTSHTRGTQIYRRMGVNLPAKAERACRAYPSADQAQLDFLRRGGPERDRLGLDPDGDGYACDWDPEPFRRAVRNRG
ncbi:hypothetical protein [Roseovarius autotrophicus]|uniref:hypothetical protein n=1 Tax=Roseovarius autotrophicus TaxID=2824121 RepID=UPI0019E5E740|nr:hypothetical protein [Roseovarius autotrophicus]MBE0453486.1 hypothetical protein [Roseovarius sp.]